MPRRREKPEAKLCRLKLQKQKIIKIQRLLQLFFIIFSYFFLPPLLFLIPFPTLTKKIKQFFLTGLIKNRKSKNFQWHALGREEQAKYYELARRERQLHMQMYPDWSSRTNATRGKKRKRKQEPTDGGTQKINKI